MSNPSTPAPAACGAPSRRADLGAETGYGPQPRACGNEAHRFRTGTTERYASHAGGCRHRQKALQPCAEAGGCSRLRVRRHARRVARESGTGRRARHQRRETAAGKPPYRAYSGSMSAPPAIPTLSDAGIDKRVTSGEKWLLENRLTLLWNSFLKTAQGVRKGRRHHRLAVALGTVDALIARFQRLGGNVLGHPYHQLLWSCNQTHNVIVRDSSE